jgi:uncharacterized protein
MTTSIPEQGIIATLRAALPTLLAVYLFGSHAQGTAGPASDLDLAVLVEGKLEPVCAWELAQTLATQVGCEVDLLDLRATSTVMQYQVITNGVRLWAKDAQAALFESAILSEKTALDTARADLLLDIQREGTVYGSKARH